MSLPRYLRYRDSGVQWLGNVPDHWNLVPLKHVADFFNGDAFKPTDWADSGIPIIRIQNLNGSADFNYHDGHVESRYLIHRGELLFGWSGNRGTSFGPFIWDRDGVYALNQHIFRVVARTVKKDALYWILKAVTSHVEDQAHGIIGMVHITKGDLGSIQIPLPPEPEQDELALFLGHETAKIDALIHEQHRLIELLKEKRQAVISHAVTRGLNPCAPMRDSGIEWLGEVPAHWEILRIGKLYRESSDCSDPELPILSVSIHHGVTDRELDDNELDRKVTRSDDRSKYKGVEPSDLVYNMMRAWQGGFGAVRVPGLVSPAYVVARPVRPISSAYMEQVLRTERAIEEMRRYSRGVTDFRLRLYWDEFKSIKVPVPPADEQSGILAHIENAVEESERLITAADSAIELLQERRTALISAAVTGKIDVRHAVTEVVA
jgi:type I restriction enzyme, S subunit